MTKKTDKALKTTFWKPAVNCPICSIEVKKEELLSGGGRLIASALTSELRRTFQPNKKFGLIYPLVYGISVCPSCYYSALPEDFSEPKKAYKDKLFLEIDHRRKMVDDFFPYLDYNQTRTLLHGCCGYILAVECYSSFDRKLNPTIKKGICSLRASWCLDDLSQEDSDNAEQWIFLRDIFYQKANVFYQKAMDYSLTSDEPLGIGIKYGPDLDKDWGYDGFTYLLAALNYRTTEMVEHDPLKKVNSFTDCKRIVSKLFGTGKFSKEKPSDLVEMARHLYDDLTDKIKSIEEESGVKANQ